MTKVTVADYIAEFLYSKKIENIFAISGASCLKILDSVDRHPSLNYFCPHHEQAGVMAALAQAQVEKKMGVMLVTAGPGAMNTMQGLASGYLDSIPVMLIAGQEKTESLDLHKNLRAWGVQGLNMEKITSPVTKYSVSIREASKIKYELEKAFHIANSGRPGPVFIEIPADLQGIKIDPESLESFTSKNEEVSYVKSVSELFALLKEAKKPLVIAGRGISLTQSESLFREVIDTLNIPFLTAWGAKSIIEYDHSLFCGHAGTYGNRSANFAVQNCDLLISFGSRLAIPQIGYDQQGYAPKAKKVIVEIDPLEFEKFQFDIAIKVIGDVAEFLTEIKSQLTQNETSPGQYQKWVERCQKWKQEYPPYGPEHKVKVKERINSYHFIDTLSDMLPEDAIIVTDMGTSLTCTHAAFKNKRGQTIITSTGLGEMGYGLPGAVGAAVGAKGSRPIIFIGVEGSLQMNIQELQTVIHHNLPIKIFIINNNGYLTIKHTQKSLFEDNNYSGSGPDSGVSFPDLGKLSIAYGFKHKRIYEEVELEAGISDVLGHEGHYFCEIMMPEEQLLGPKTSFKILEDGTFVSPPLEDLYPFLPEEEVKRNMETDE